MSDEPVYQLSFAQRIMVLITVMLGNTIYAASVLISSALLPQLQGAMSATQDEVSWVMTFNIVATAVATPATGWLANRFSQRSIMIWSATIFTVSTFMCGASRTLEELIFWRIIQGAAGAPLVPLGQSFLLDCFPRRQHAIVISIFGMANMIGPSLGPMLAGQIAESLGWQWGFWMIVPVGALAVAGNMFFLPGGRADARARLDWLGFLSLSAGIAAAQMVFSRGQRLDWFESSEIIVATLIAASAIYVFCMHSLSSSRPFVRLTLLTDRNYSVGLLLVMLFGMLNFSVIVLLPPLLQQQAGFPDSAIGEIVGARGVGSAIGFFAAMPMARIDPRIGMTLGALLQATTGLWLMSLDLNADLGTLIWCSALQGTSIGVLWVPMTSIAFSTLAPELRAEALSIFHLLRNFGSSLFISIAVAEIVRTQSANYARMVEFVSPYNRVMDIPSTMGAWRIDTASGLAKLSNEIARQSLMIGYTNAWLLYTIAAVLVIPLCLLSKAPKGGFRPS